MRRRSPSGGQCALDLRRRQLKLRAHVGRNRKQGLLGSASTGLDGFAGIDHQVGQRAFRLLDMGLDAERQLFGARQHHIAGLPSARFEAACHSLDPRSKKILELRDTCFDRGRDKVDALIETLMDFLEPRRDRIRKVGAAIVDGFSNSGDVPFYRRGGLCCAFGQRRREVGEAALDRAESHERHHRTATR